MSYNYNSTTTTTDYIYSGEISSGTTSGSLLVSGGTDSTWSVASSPLISKWGPISWNFDDNFIKQLSEALEKNNKEDNQEKTEIRWDINSKRKERISRVSVYIASRESEINLSTKRRRRVQVRI